MITLAQAKALRRGQWIYHMEAKNADGTPRRWKVSGVVKLWKRDPSRVEFPVKCGMYVHDRVTQNDLHLFSLDPSLPKPEMPLEWIEDMDELLRRAQ